MKRQPGNILAIDASLVCSGIVIKKASSVNYTTMTAEPPKGMKGMARIMWIHDFFENIVYTNHIDTVVIEGYSYGSNKAYAKEIAELGGVLRFSFYKSGISVYEVPPMTLKKFTCGTGKAKKDLMLLNVYKRWGFETDNDNVADAYALMKYYEANIAGGK